MLDRMDRLPLTKYHKTLWLVCTLAWFFDGYEQASPAALLPFQFQEFHFTALSSGLIISSTGIGLLIGSYLFGYLSDRMGRRTIFQVDLLVYSIFSGLRIFATGWIDLFIYTLIGNAGIAGMFAVDAAYIAEYLPPKNRGKWQAAMVVTLVLGFIFVAAFMPIIPLFPTLFGLPFGWRLIPLIGSLPAFLLFWARRALPESVRFLLSKGRVEEAAKIVVRLEASAGPTYHYDGPVVAPQLARIGKANPKLFFVKPYVFYTIPLWLGWLVFYFVQTAQFFMPTVFMMGLGGGVTGLMSTFIIVELTNASKITARVFTALTIDKLGRRGNMFIGCALGAIGMAAWAYPWAHRTEVPFLYVILPGMLSLWSDCWFMAFTASSSELYPIEARSMAYGWGTGVGRLGAVFGPLFMVALLANIEVFFYSIAVCWLIVLVITWKWIPETAKARIEESSKETVFKTAAETRKMTQ